MTYDNHPIPSKYPKVKKIPGNTRSYFSTLLPDPNPTRYPVFCSIPDPTRPDIEKPYLLGTEYIGGREKVTKKVNREEDNQIRRKTPPTKRIGAVVWSELSMAVKKEVSSQNVSRKSTTPSPS